MFGKKRRLPTYHLSSHSLSKSRIPRFGNRRPHPTLNKFKKIFFLVILSGGLVFFIYSMAFSAFFNLKEIVIVNKNFENDSIANQIKDTLKTSLGKNIFVLDNAELERKLLSSFPELEKLRISKNYPETLNIEFYEYPLVANVINESSEIKKSYILNSIGYAIKENLENPALPYIKIKTDEPINPQKAVIEKTRLGYILESKIYFEDKFGLRISNIEYKPVAREVHLQTERNFFIWLDLQKSYEEQFKKLKKALVKLDIHKENLQYIDLRIAGSSGDKIIYKRKP